MTRLVLLSGFLGAGKTTLLKAVLSEYEGEKTGVIINEFGEVGIDGVLVRREGLTLTELNNGSIFCACIKDKFCDSLIEMAKLELDYLFIEASGLADPANMPRILAGISSRTGDVYQYCGAVCVVDGDAFLEEYEILPAIHHQIVCSGVILLNKADLAGQQKIDQIVKTLGEINPNAPVYVTSHCQAPIRRIVEGLAGGSLYEADSVNTYENRPNTYVLKSETPLPAEPLRQFLQEVSKSAYRIKGFADTDQGRMEISAVGRRVELIPWEEEGPTEIVAISSVGIRMTSVLIQASKQYLQGTLHL